MLIMTTQARQLDMEERSYRMWQILWGEWIRTWAMVG